MGKERRKHERVPLGLVVQFRTETYDDLVTTYGSNISHSGMFIFIQNQLRASLWEKYVNMKYFEGWMCIL